MKCLVTGATGFLGTNLVHELVKQGWDVLASGMHGSETRYLDELAVEVVLADITKAAEVDAIVEGCEVVFHVAGDTSFWRHYFDRQRRINVDGSVNVAEACIRHGVKRMVHTSTADVFGYNPSGGTIDETAGHSHFDNMAYNYGETKKEADRRLREYSDQLEVVFIHPGFMVGPYDYTLQIGRVFFDIAEGKLPGYPPGGSSFCHVAEVAKAHIAAATKGRPGESYICAGMPHSNLSYADMFRRMAQAINAKPPRFTIPRSLFVLYGYGCELVSEITRKPPEMNPGQARYMSEPQYGVSNKAIRELDYHVPEVESCIADALSWYRQAGYEI